MTEPSPELIRLEFGIGKSIRYHARRRSFFDAWHRTAMAITAIGGSAAFVAVIGDGAEIAKWAALAVAVAAAADVVFAFGEKARHHDALAERFSDLAAEIVRSSKPNDQQVRQWRARRLEIEKMEPTALLALDIRCHNEEARARGYGLEHQCRVRWWQTAVCHLLTLPPHSFDPLAETAPQPADQPSPNRSVSVAPHNV